MKKAILPLLFLILSFVFAQESEKEISKNLRAVSESVIDYKEKEATYKNIYHDILREDLKSRFSHLNDAQAKELCASIIKNFKSNKNVNITEEEINEIDKGVKVYKISYLKNYLLKLYGFDGGGDFKIEQIDVNTFNVKYNPTVYKKDSYSKEFKIT